MADEVVQPAPDPQQILQQTRESVTKIRDMAQAMRSVLMHEETVAGDLMRVAEETLETNRSQAAHSAESK
jgi:hypothetical protein